MRIVHLIARLNDGGPARVLREWCTHSQRLGHQVRIVCGRCDPHEPDISDQLRAAGITIDVLPALGRSPLPWRDGLALAAIIRHLRRLQPDILHTHTAKAGVLGRLAARWLRLPCLHTYHGHVLSGYWSAPINALIRQVERLAAGWGHCHSLSPSLVRELRDHHGIGHPRRWHCLPIPIAGLTSKPKVPAQQLAAQWQLSGWDPQRPTIGFVGRLVPVKDPLLMVEAIRQLLATQTVQVLICGDGPLRSSVEEAIASLPTAAWCCGFVPAAEAFSLIDVLVISSHNEGLPLTLIEAASCAVPVVACDVGGLRDLESGPFLYRCPRQAADLAAAIEQALKADPAEIRRQAQSLTLRHHSAEVVARYIALYHQIAPAADHHHRHPSAKDA